MEAKQVLNIALSAGQMLLSNGAEAYRVEETIERICSSYGLECECLSTAKGVFVSIVDNNDEKLTSLKKIKGRRVDLYRIELINSFSRSLQDNPVSYDVAKKTLKDIELAPYFTFPLRLLAASLYLFTVFQWKHLRLSCFCSNKLWNILYVRKSLKSWLFSVF